VVTERPEHCSGFFHWYSLMRSAPLEKLPHDVESFDEHAGNEPPR
jgi:hypothetical protein